MAPQNLTEVEDTDLIPVIMGKRSAVPPSLTIMKAMEYAGYRLLRGCGCRGGLRGMCRSLSHSGRP
jgi:hypothetical protein